MRIHGFVSTLTEFLSAQVTDQSLFQQHRVWIVASAAIAVLAVYFLYRSIWKWKSNPVTGTENSEILAGEPNQRLVDQKLRDIVKLSGPGSDRFGAYVTGNDIGFEITKQEIEGECPENGVHIGCAGWHNFDLMYVRRSKFGILMDMGEPNRQFLELTHTLILEAPNREAFVERMIEQLSHREIKIGEDIIERSLEQRLCDQLKSESSWLSSDDSFHYIQALFREGKIVAITLSFTDTEQLKTMKQLLLSQNLSVDSLYLCNVRNFIPELEQELFATSLNSLVDRETWVIHCPHVLTYRDGNGPINDDFPVKDQSNSRLQAVIRGQDLLSHPVHYFVREAKHQEDKNRLE